MKIEYDKNTLNLAGDETRPVYEQTLLRHLDNLLAYMQYDCLSNEERHNTYHAASAILMMFVKNGRPIPQHFMEWLIEINVELMEGEI